MKNSFFGRQDVLGLLKKRVNDLKDGYRQNIAILGAEFIGKTSIVEHFIHNLDDDKIIPLYLNLRGMSFYNFAISFMGKMLFNFLEVKNFLNQNENLKILMEACKEFIPETIEKIQKIKSNLENDKFNDAYRELISLPEIFTIESGLFCLIVLDEFQYLEAYNIPNTFQELGKKIMVQRKSLYIVISSLRIIAKKILSEELALLFGNFEMIEIGPFDTKTSNDFIEFILKEISIDKTKKDFLIDLTSGYPFYLSVMVEELHHTCLRFKEDNVTNNSLITAIEQLLFYRWGILNQHFSNILSHLHQGKDSNICIAILLSISNGFHKVKDILANVNSYRKLIPQKINRLIDLNILSKNGDFYYFYDRLFSFWLKFIYQNRLSSLVEADYRNEKFKHDLENLINRFILNSHKELTQRIVDLFSLFNNEGFQLNGHRLKFSNFNDIKTIDLDNASSNRPKIIIAESLDRIWLILVNDGLLTDLDIVKFLAECKRYKEKAQKRIIVSTNELDSNAKLRALQEKASIWKASDLNLLFKLYKQY